MNLNFDFFFFFSFFCLDIATAWRHFNLKPLAGGFYSVLFFSGHQIQSIKFTHASSGWCHVVTDQISSAANLPWRFVLIISHDTNFISVHSTALSNSAHNHK